MRFINMHDGTGDEHCVFQRRPYLRTDGPVIRAGVCAPFTGWILLMQLSGACFDAMHKVRASSEQHDRRIFVALQRDSKPPNDGRFSWSSSLNL
jgi:hypothetical protein